jgi:hypothetical protein
MARGFRSVSGWILCAGALSFPIGCGKKHGNEASQARIGPDTASASRGDDSLQTEERAEPAKRGAAVSHGLDGFYVNKEYLEGLIRNRSIFATRFPARSVYLQVHGDSAELDFSNHEGLMAGLRPLGDSGLVKDPAGEDRPAAVALGRIKDSLYLAWESGSAFAAEFIRMGGGINTIYALYHSLLLDGKYLCGDARMCRDTVTLAGDSIFGLMGRNHHIQVAIDWLDNLPQMDYFVLSNADSSFHLAYQSSGEKLELFEIALPQGCRSFRDYECPLADATRRKKVLELHRIAGKNAANPRIH